MGGCVTSTAGRVKDIEADLVLGRYAMTENRRYVLGEGASSICYKGTDVVTGEHVAIKVYKPAKSRSACLTQFRRQVAVLQELQEPLLQPADPKLWCEELSQVQSGDLFVRLLGYSKDQTGEPGPAYQDGRLYIVTELAQYDLKKYLRECRETGEQLSKEKVYSIAKAIILAGAGLHAKGFTHLDLKPANLMMFGGRWKLIDVDGCTRVGDTVNADDETISFSPCYCAPEWARFVIQEPSEPMVADPSLDTWSIGMTLCELILLDPPMKKKYQAFAANAKCSSRNNACYKFLSWLGRVQQVQLPGAIGTFDSGLHDLLSTGLLVCDRSTRKTLAECLACPYLSSPPVPDVPILTDASLHNAMKRAGSGHSLVSAHTVAVN